MVQRILGPKLKNKNVNSLKWLNQFAVSMDTYQYVKNQHHSSIQSWHIADCVPDHTHMTELNQIDVTKCKKSNSYLSSCLRYSYLVVFSHFRHALPHSLEMIEEISNFYRFRTTCKKTTIAQLTLVMKLTHYLA